MSILKTTLLHLITTSLHSQTTMLLMRDVFIYQMTFPIFRNGSFSYSHNLFKYLYNEITLEWSKTAGIPKHEYVGNRYALKCTKTYFGKSHFGNVWLFLFNNTFITYINGKMGHATLSLFLKILILILLNSFIFPPYITSAKINSYEILSIFNIFKSQKRSNYHFFLLKYP